MTSMVKISATTQGQSGQNMNSPSRHGLSSTQRLVMFKSCSSPRGAVSHLEVKRCQQVDEDSNTFGNTTANMESEMTSSVGADDC